MYRFANVEAVLVDSLGLGEESKSRFSARIKQLKRSGFPQGVNVGKLNNFEYGARELMQLHLIFEFIKYGISPDPAIFMLNQWWPSIAFIGKQATKHSRVFLSLRPLDWSGLRSAEEEAVCPPGCEMIKLDENAKGQDIEKSSCFSGRANSAIILNMSRIMLRIHNSIDNLVRNDLSGGQFFNEVLSWNDSDLANQQKSIIEGIKFDEDINSKNPYLKFIDCISPLY